MPLTDAQEAVLAAFADTISAAAVAASIEPVAFATTYGAGGAALVSERTLQAQADALRAKSRTAAQAAEASAQALEAKARAIQAGLQAAAGAGASA